MPEPADDAGRDGAPGARGLQVNEAVLRRRLAAMADLAHANAVETVVVAEERDALRRQIDEGAQVADLRVQLRAVTAELERLRSIPELRAGQRLRHVAKSVRRDESNPGTANLAGEERISGGPSVTGSQGSTETATSAATDTPVQDSATGAAIDTSVQDSADATNSSPTSLSYPLMESPTAVITFRNRGEALAAVVSKLRALGIVDVVLVDNASSDPALAETLDWSAATVIRLDVDLGADAPWATGVMAKLLAIGNVLDVVGHAVPSIGCPDDVLDRMTEELRRRPEVDAVDLRHDSDSSHGEIAFRLLRRGLRSRPLRIAQLDSPYSAMAIRSEPSEPTERYARLQDDISAPDASVADNA